MNLQLMLYFFSESRREADLSFRVLEQFFTNQSDFVLKTENNNFIFTYDYKHLGYPVNFIITKKSITPDVYLIDSKYNDMNFHFEINIITPNYIFSKALEIIEKLVKLYNYKIFASPFKKVIDYDREFLLNYFIKSKQLFFTKNPSLYNNYLLVNQQLLTYVLYYEGKKEELEIHYKDEDINVLDYLILRDSNNKAYLSCEYIFDLVAIFPPNLDYIYIKPKGVKILVKYEEFKKELSRFLTNVAGCPDTYKMIEPLKLNKVWKVLKKVKWHEEIDNYNIVYYKDLID